MVLGAASERPHGFCGLGGQVFDGEDELDVGHVGGGGCGEYGAVHGAEGGEGFLAVDVVDQEGLDDVQLDTDTDTVSMHLPWLDWESGDSPHGRRSWRAPCPWSGRSWTGRPR